MIDGATLHRDRLHPDRASAPTGSTRAATARSSTSPTAARTTSAGRRDGHGQRVGARLRHAQGRGHLADPRRRQPRHGQRERRRQDAVALRPLRRRRLRDRHHDRRGRRASRSAGSRTASPSGPSPAATRSATPATCASAMIRAHLLRWRPRQPAQRTESTPRRLPSGAASQLDPSHRSAALSDRLSADTLHKRGLKGFGEKISLD